MMISTGHEILLYGSEKCSKTIFYQRLLRELGLEYELKDVEQSKTAANELINLYKTRRLNYPTIMLGSKKLRNPSTFTLKRWLDKLNYTYERNYS